MKQRSVSLGGLALAAIMAFSPLVATAQEATPEAPISIGEARVIGMQILPNDLVVDDTLVGGLSSIDYDPATDQWIAISDDRSFNAPSRFYTLSVDYSAESLDGVTINDSVTLLQANGEPYAADGRGRNVADIEAVRFDPLTGLVWYSTEAIDSLNLSPWLAVATMDGQFVSQPALPSMFDLDPERIIGPRNNQGFEALSFSADGNTLWLGLENGLAQDGPLATHEAGSTTRITNIDRAGNLISQFAYELAPIPVETPAFFDTGLSEILAIDDTRFLTLERTTVQDAEGVFNNYINIYEIDTAGATDIKGRTWLEGEEFVPVSKKLVLDLNTTGIELDNIEGMAWGPVLENGNRSLVLVSDNNFDETQLTQFVAVEVAS